METAINRLKEKIALKPFGMELLPEVFSAGQLNHLYKSIVGHEVDLAKLVNSRLLVVKDEKKQLFSFDKVSYRKESLR